MKRKSNIIYLWLLLVIPFIFFSCKARDKHSHEDALILKIDNSSPDRFIKDIWRYSLMRDTIFCDDTLSIHYKWFSKNFKSYTKNGLSGLYREDYILLSTKLDSTIYTGQNKAIVYTRELSQKDLKKYKPFYYVLSKENGKWFIDDILSDCLICNGAGNNPYSSRIEDTCQYCDGEKIISLLKFRKHGFFHAG